MLLKLLLGALIINSANASCPAGTVYESIFNKCYKFVNEPLSFLAAESKCQDMGGHLVALSNAFENAYVSGIVNALGSAASYWIGADLLFATNWTWTSNANLDFTNWAIGQPSDPSAKQCAAVRDVDNLWTKEMCNLALPYVCEVNASAVTEKPNPSPTCLPCEPYRAPCSDGYQLFPDTNRCYKYIYFGLAVTSYNDAVKRCSNDNGALAKITSAGLNEFLSSLCCSSYPWIGLQCPSASISDCRWPDGSNTSDYSNFYPENPQSGMPYVYLGDGYWYSANHYTTIGAALCEKAPYDG